MLNLILVVIAVIIITVVLVWLIDRYIPTKFKPLITLILWVIIGVLGYKTFMSIYEPIQFNKVKEKRYAKVIKDLVDVRDSQLAYQEVTGTFASDFPTLVKFIDTAKFTITQKKDSTVLDREATRRYGGVETYKEITITEVLGHVAVKDSLFKNSNRYTTMDKIDINGTLVPVRMKTGEIGEEDKPKIPVFEAKVLKNDILFDQNKDLLIQENEVVSVDGVNGDAIRVGSLEEVNTSGNWPKTYGDNE